MTAEQERQMRTAKQAREREIAGLPPKTKFISHDPMQAIRQSVAEAVQRGSAEIADNRRRLAADPASSANRRAASAAAQKKNQPAINMLKAGACRAFNPVAQKA
jgi:hypothetical protein